jgi:hypothetical protein
MRFGKTTTAACPLCKRGVTRTVVRNAPLTIHKGRCGTVVLVMDLETGGEHAEVCGGPRRRVREDRDQLPLPLSSTMQRV